MVKKNRQKTQQLKEGLKEVGKAAVLIKSTEMTEKTQPLKKYSEGIAKAVTFLKETLGKEGNLVKATKKDDNGWEVEIEVVEQSEYMKRIGIPKPVYDKNIYQVLLDRNFELISYERRGQKPFGGAPNN